MTPSFPPLLRGAPATAPFAAAIDEAKTGTDPGLILWHWDGTALEAALVLAPEQPLQEALGAVLAVTNALADALGNAAPAGLPLHFGWPGVLRVNGGLCGGMRFAASTADAEEEPDWLVVAFTLPFATDLTETGADPDRTALREEGCGEVEPIALLESWSRHVLHWLSRMEDEGMRGVHADWMGRAWGVGQPLTVAGVTGTFTGLDEHGGLLLATPDGTRLVPLSQMLETP